MKKIAAVLAISATIASCASKKAQNLPKDAALKPPREAAVTIEENFRQLRSEIDSISNPVVCTDASAWRISPIGSKPCGGPAGFIAYPVEFENEILPKIRNYTQMSTEYNRKRKLFSDCAIVPPPSGIRCENGKPVLIGGNGTADVY